MAWWEVIDVSDWPERQPEQRGLRAKSWVSDPHGRLWLRKSIRSSRPTEAAIEAFTLELARRCGLEVAHGRAATWTTQAGIVRGFVSLRFHEDTEEQWTGAELVPGFDRDSEESRIAATLPRAYESLSDLPVGIDEHDDLLERFTRMVLFDACIGNGDRHLGNWAVLVSPGADAGARQPGLARFAPIFDTAGCLGAELQDGHRLLKPDVADEDIAKYAHGCKSGYGDGATRPGIFQDDVIAIARTWPEWKWVYPDLFSRFLRVLDHEVDAMLAEVPEDWWSEARRRFARRLLGVRVKILEGAAP